MRCLVVLVLLTTPAFADDDVPPATGKLADKVVAMTNQFFDRHVDLLTYDLLHLRVDAQHRAAKIAIGGGDARLLKLRVAGDVEVVDGTARIKSRVALAVGGKRLDVRLPSLDVAPATYPHRFGGDRYERGVELRLPLLRRQF
ncbi:MAG TPA: hypothetical protein VIV11_18870 [Kofleriaceae bacterium]